MTFIANRRHMGIRLSVKHKNVLPGLPGIAMLGLARCLSLLPATRCITTWSQKGFSK